MEKSALIRSAGLQLVAEERIYYAYMVAVLYGGAMYKTIGLAVLLCSVFAWSQDQSATQRRAAGCGDNGAKFRVIREGQQHSTGTPEPGKALVYVFGDSEFDNTALNIGGLITRVGIDGTWQGAYEHKSYMYFPADPGEHRLCTSQQSSIKSRTNNAAAITFTAEEGKVYYFRTQPTPTALTNSAATGVPNGKVELAVVDPAQAQLMIPKWAYSTSLLKK